MSEKSITRQQAGLVRRARTSRRDSADVAGACSAAEFVVEGAGEEYDAPGIERWVEKQSDIGKRAKEHGLALTKEVEATLE